MTSEVRGTKRYETEPSYLGHGGPEVRYEGGPYRDPSYLWTWPGSGPLKFVKRYEGGFVPFGDGSARLSDSKLATGIS
jgi:hypothetical protein